MNRKRVRAVVQLVGCGQHSQLKKVKCRSEGLRGARKTDDTLREKKNR